MSEAQEQAKIVTYCTLRGIPMFAIPNGGKRDAKEAHFLKIEGVKPGVPDMMFPAARHGYHGLFIELKVGKNKPTDNQRQWLADLTEQGYLAEVCYGFEEARALIDDYFNLK